MTYEYMQLKVYPPPCLQLEHIIANGAQVMQFAILSFGGLNCNFYGRKLLISDFIKFMKSR